MTPRFSNHRKNKKRVTFGKEDHFVIICPQYEDHNRVSIFDLRSRKMPPNVSSRTSDYSAAVEDKGGSHRLPDAVSERLSHAGSGPISTPLKSILKKKPCVSRMDGAILKVEPDSTGLNTAMNRNAAAFRGVNSCRTSSRAQDRNATISGRTQDKGIYSRSQTGLPFTTGQKTDGGTASPLSSRNKRALSVGCTATTGRLSTGNHSAQSSKSPHRQGSIHIIRPFSGVTYDVPTTAGRGSSAGSRWQVEGLDSNFRSAVRTAMVGSDRKLNVVGIPMSVSDLYPALQKLEKITERAEKLYKNILAHSAVTTPGSENAHTAFRKDYDVASPDTLLRRSYSSAHSSSENLWRTKRTGLSNSRTEGGAGRTTLAAWPPNRSGQGKPSATRLSSSVADRKSFSDLHKS